VLFAATLAVPPGAQPALEDYARALASARAAAVIGSTAGPARVAGVHLCGAPVPPAEPVREDLEAFARELVARADEGLGWS
jgi:hypothetical protein